MAQFRLSILLLCLASISALFSFPVLAQMPCSPLDDRGYIQEFRGERTEQRHKALRDALKLNADQQADWKKLIDSERSRPWANPEKTIDWAKLTTLERAEKMHERLTTHAAAMAEHLVVLKAFYAILTPAQKKIFDDFHAAPYRGTNGKPPPLLPEPLPPRAAAGTREVEGDPTGPSC